ncbi:putative glutathione-dependent formaldehyde-activating [Cladophialophora carrionii]|uniref:Putative glutathione-dependent formaldehyde-activating n=1 Tax=Cladophialophora carrionii TaxID=86049 RepID=A0A1C1CKT7_9EURO|nr:putative glutathione-dependent formaldehyde-activating [Cladophialophora carrionii]
MEGECLCKAVAVKVNDDNLFGEQRRGHICHCNNCRKVAGGIFGVNLTIEEEKVEFPKGKDNIKAYTVSLSMHLIAIYLSSPSAPHRHLHLIAICVSSPSNCALTHMMRMHDPDTLSGTPLQRFFCQTCGVPIMSITPLYKGKVVLKLGLYPKLPVPEWESFAERRQHWEKPFEGTIQYKTKVRSVSF